MQNHNWTLYKISVSKIEINFIKIFTQIISCCNSFWCYFFARQSIAMATHFVNRKIYLKFGLHDYSTNCMS